MSIFKDVSSAVTARDAAIHYGLKINPNHMAVCPFHNDKNPSLKIDSRFYCFGCQANGDAIDFTALYFGLSPLDAAKKLADDFGIPYDQKPYHPIQKPQIRMERHAKRQDDVQKDYQTLCSWLHVLKDWEETEKPEHPESDLTDHYTLALRYRAQLEYILDELFLQGSEDDIQAFRKENRELLDVLHFACRKQLQTEKADPGSKKRLSA